MIAGGRPCKPPLSIAKGNYPSAHLVREQCYHGLGLLPWINAQPWVVTPHVFSPTKWCCRKLTVQERLYSRDLSKSCLAQLSPVQQGHLSADTNYIPEKCCLGVIDSIMKTQAQPEQQPITGINSPASGLTLGVLQIHQSNIDSPTVGERLEKERAFKRIQAATKADDAVVPVELWDSRVLPDMDPEKRTLVLIPLQHFFLRWWRKTVRRCFLSWFRNHYKMGEVGSTRSLKLILRNKRLASDWEAGRDCIRRCILASWWDWDAGSRPLFWRWPSEYLEIIKDGLPPWYSSAPPAYTVPQRGEPDPVIHAKVSKKLSIVKAKGYLAEGPVKSLTSFFTVPKGDQDVRVVYNGTKSGLNACLWAPWFRLPTIDQHL